MELDLADSEDTYQSYECRYCYLYLLKKSHYHSLKRRYLKNIFFILFLYSSLVIVLNFSFLRWKKIAHVFLFLGLKFCESKIMELYQNATASVSRYIIEYISLFIHHSEWLSMHVPAFLEALSLLQPIAQNSLLLTSLFIDEVNVANSMRYIVYLNSVSFGAMLIVNT